MSRRRTFCACLSWLREHAKATAIQASMVGVQKAPSCFQGGHGALESDALRSCAAAAERRLDARLPLGSAWHAAAQAAASAIPRHSLAAACRHRSDG